MVPSPTGTPMPDKESVPDNRARLYSVYMRPWVLDKTMATPEVPHITDLDLLPKRRLRLRGKQSSQNVNEPERSFSESWRHYIRGHVVSRHACKIIVQFMAANCGKTSRTENPEEEANAANTCPTNLPNNALPLARVHHILDHMAISTETASAKTKAAEEDGSDEEYMQQVARSEQVTNALKVTARLWSRSTTSWPETPVDITTSSLSSTPPLSRNTVRTSQENKQVHPRAMQSRAYITWKESSVQNWLKDLKKLPEPPTPEHMAFLQRVVDRCRQEHNSLRNPRTQIFEEEPVRDCLLGIPGAGKSSCIKLLRRFFEECLCWEDGVQFQFLAIQNTMAALIGGKTIHSFGTIPVNSTDAMNKGTSKSADGDVDELFLQVLGMRWIIIDEISTVSPELLGLLDLYLRRACSRHPFLRRPHGASKRPFGGINIIFAGDFWQLTPVKSISLFANPFKKGPTPYTAQEQKNLKMLLLLVNRLVKLLL